MIMRGRNLSAGFTLVEALVVLVITSLVSVVLVQGFGLILSARTSFENKLVAVDQAILQSNILLEPLRGIVPDYPDRSNVFAGTDTGLRALTTRPLQGRTGTPVGFNLSFDFDVSRNETRLIYQEVNAAAKIVGQWEGRRGTFAYRDKTGDWSEVWPPPSADSFSQIPWLIRVEVGEGFPSTFIASLNSGHQRRPRFSDGPMAAISGGKP